MDRFCRSIAGALLILAACALLLLLMAREGFGDETDPFKICATKVLRGDYGKVNPKVLAAYRRGLEQGKRVKGNVFLTCYWDAEGRDSRWDCRGRRCGDLHLAANRLPLDTWVWVQWPLLATDKHTGKQYIIGYKSQMRQVLDRGAKRNDRVADRKGCDLWIDRHTSRPYPTRIGKYAVIGR